MLVGRNGKHHARRMAMAVAGLAAIVLVVGCTPTDRSDPKTTGPVELACASGNSGRGTGTDKAQQQLDLPVPPIRGSWTVHRLGTPPDRLDVGPSDYEMVLVLTFDGDGAEVGLRSAVQDESGQTAESGAWPPEEQRVLLPPCLPELPEEVRNSAQTDESGMLVLTGPGASADGLLRQDTGTYQTGTVVMLSGGRHLAIVLRTQ